MTTVERDVFANRAALERADAIAMQAEADLRDHLHDLQKHGLRYMREYAETLTGKKTIRRPVPHMHPKLAELIRELVMDAAVTDRRTCGAAACALANRGDGLASPQSSRRKVAA